jgi:hypothetical protein
MPAAADMSVTHADGVRPNQWGINMKRLSKRQLAVIDDLFAGELDEQTILAKYNVSKTLYNRWLADDRFIEQFNERIYRAYRQGQLIIARYAPLAAAKLVQLTDCEKAETARKACLDILSLPTVTGKNAVINTDNEVSTGLSCLRQEDAGRGRLSPDTASRLLAALAEEQDGEGR